MTTTDTTSDVFVALALAGIPNAVTQQGSPAPGEGWPVVYAGGRATDAVLAAVDLTHARWTVEDEGTRLAAHPDHVQSLHADPAARLAVVVVNNTFDGESWLHVFGYGTDEHFEFGVESQRVAPHAAHVEDRPDDPSPEG